SRVMREQPFKRPRAHATGVPRARPRRPAPAATPGGARRGAPGTDRSARVRRALRDSTHVERLSRTFRALGDPTRSKLVLALSFGDLCVTELAEALGRSLSATSHQLRILRDLDIVRVRRHGKSQVYALNEQAFGFCAPRICQAWKQTLDREPLVVSATKPPKP